MFLKHRIHKSKISITRKNFAHLRVRLNGSTGDSTRYIFGRKHAQNSQNQTKSRENPDFFYTYSNKSVKLELSNDKGFKEFSRLSRLSRPKNEKGGIIHKKIGAKIILWGSDKSHQFFE